ncbi:hypothetical protein HMPREF9193_02223 [Treponema lecithinolyticum ATCC 700332]|uniref:Uncharacterized protein n=1 Tax=Treponema lecithinolyticum ATCC 700332 TaxID=1321815 RepID=A0ABN0NVX9_TRELE|nr:hypothetical protein HMPREF9193_02223 [Treponema lecithinolyticum ATCC 700332]
MHHTKNKIFVLSGFEAFRRRQQHRFFAFGTLFVYGTYRFEMQ